MSTINGAIEKAITATTDSTTSRNRQILSKASANLFGGVGSYVPKKYNYSGRAQREKEAMLEGLMLEKLSETYEESCLPDYCKSTIQDVVPDMSYSEHLYTTPKQGDFETFANAILENLNSIAERLDSKEERLFKLLTYRGINEIKEEFTKLRMVLSDFAAKIDFLVGTGFLSHIDDKCINVDDESTSYISALFCQCSNISEYANCLADKIDKAISVRDLKSTMSDFCAVNLSDIREGQKAKAMQCYEGVKRIPGALDGLMNKVNGSIDNSKVVRIEEEYTDFRNFAHHLTTDPNTEVDEEDVADYFFYQMLEDIFIRDNKSAWVNGKKKKHMDDIEAFIAASLQLCEKKFNSIAKSMMVIFDWLKDHDIAKADDKSRRYYIRYFQVFHAPDKTITTSAAQHHYSIDKDVKDWFCKVSIGDAIRCNLIVFK